MIRDDYEDDEYIHHHHRSPGDEEEIAFPDVGKLVKGLWRSLSRSKDKQDNSKPSDTTHVKQEEEGEEEGRVWEESIGSGWSQPGLIFREPFQPDETTSEKPPARDNL